MKWMRVVTLVAGGAFVWNMMRNKKTKGIALFSRRNNTSKQLLKTASQGMELATAWLKRKPIMQMASPLIGRTVNRSLKRLVRK